MVEIVHLYISPGHNYFGHHGQAPGRHPALSCKFVECVTGRGLRGDRFFDFKGNYHGQVTFFADEVYKELGQMLNVTDRSPMVFRRNIIIRGVDLNELIGWRFLLGGILFEGVEECRPCAWMNEAFAAGAEQALRGRGGLRARILSDGVLWQGSVDCELLDAVFA